MRDLDGKIDGIVSEFTDAMKMIRDDNIALAAQNDKDFDATGNWANTANLVIDRIAVLVSLGTARRLSRQITLPINAMTEAMRTLAGGNRTVEVPGLLRKDEIGGMADALNVFKQAAIEMDRMMVAKEEE